jgi:hypothetical protein
LDDAGVGESSLEMVVTVRHGPWGKTGCLFEVCGGALLNLLIYIQIEHIEKIAGNKMILYRSYG